jgi:hypothetical protein
LNKLREKYRAGDPVSFTADITTATELDQVLIVALDILECNDAARSVRYRIVLREYVEPPEPPAAIDDLGLGLDGDLDLLADLGLDGLELPGEPRCGSSRRARRARPSSSCCAPTTASSSPPTKLPRAGSDSPLPRRRSRCVASI